MFGKFDNFYNDISQQRRKTDIVTKENELSMSIIEEKKYEQSLFNLPEVSPVKTNKHSFAGKDESASILDLYPQIMLRKNSRNEMSPADSFQTAEKAESGNITSASNSQ